MITSDPLSFMQDDFAEFTSNDAIGHNHDSITGPEMGSNDSSLEANSLFSSVQRHLVSGRYQGRTGAFELVLRIDVDGNSPLNKISGDFYQITPSAKTYVSSFILNNPSISYTSNQVRVEGIINTTHISFFNFIRVTIVRNALLQSKAPAIFQSFRGVNGPSGTIYTCGFQSSYFRSLSYEQDMVAGLNSFVSYNTGSLPSGGANRTLSVSGAFAEAGIELINTNSSNIVNTAGIGGAWSNAELHNAMINYFSAWSNSAEWRVWLLEAMLHEAGPGLYGIMFDQQGQQRQGCAVFHSGIGGNSATSQRLQLYTYVHELGHCFNLLHSWQKNFGNPPSPNRPTSLSWMNYPWNSAFPNASTFWNNFAFQFDKQELIHLRHAYRNNIIMGGSDFGVGSALSHSDGDNLIEFSDPIEDYSNLSLRLESKKSFILGEPVVVELRLALQNSTHQTVNTLIHPNYGFLKLAIKKSSGETSLYEPMIEHLAIPNWETLTQSNPAIYDSAYIGYGKDGFVFQQPGVYSIKASYWTKEGQIVSNEIKLMVRMPINKNEVEISELYMGDEQGMLFYLLGSDSQALTSGNAAFEQVLEKHKSHPLSAYAALVKGMNAGREFKYLHEDKTLTVRKEDVEENSKMMELLVKHSKGDQGVDNITLNEAMRNMASCQLKDGQLENAKNTMQTMVSIFKQKEFKPHVMQHIVNQSEEIFNQNDLSA